MATNKALVASLDSLARDIEVAATWHSGPRANRLVVLAARARAIGRGDLGDEVDEQVKT